MQVGVRVSSDMPAIARRFPPAVLSPSLAANVEPLCEALHQVLKASPGTRAATCIISTIFCIAGIIICIIGIIFCINDII